jgi:drug/metabolite transporter (DMT)-like permease
MALRAYALLILTALFWSGNAIAGRLAVGHISPMLLTAIRWGLCWLVASLLAIPHLRRDWPVLRRNTLLLFAYGGIGFTAFNGLFYTAAHYTTALNIVILQSGLPLFIFIISFALFGLRVSAGQAAGFVLTLAGVLATASNGSFAALLHLHVNRGDALMLLAVLFYSFYTAALRWKPKVHWLSFMAAISLGAFLTSALLALWEGWDGVGLWPDARGWAVALYAAIFPGLIAQASFIAGAGILGSNRAGLFINLVPVFGAILSLTILGEALRPYHILGLALVLSGLALAERRRPAEA